MNRTLLLVLGLLLASALEAPRDAAAQSRLERLRQEARTAADQAAARLADRAIDRVAQCVAGDRTCAPAEAQPEPVAAEPAAGPTPPSTAASPVAAAETPTAAGAGVEGWAAPGGVRTAPDSITDRLLEAYLLLRSLPVDSIDGALPEPRLTPEQEKAILLELTRRWTGIEADASIFDLLRARAAESAQTAAAPRPQGRSGSPRTALAGLAGRAGLAGQTAGRPVHGFAFAPPPAFAPRVAPRSSVRHRSAELRPPRVVAASPDPDAREVRETTEQKVVEGVPVTIYQRDSAWQERGKIGREILLRMTTSAPSGSTSGTKVEEILTFMEVRYCPDPLGLAPGTGRHSMKFEFTGQDAGTRSAYRLYGGFETTAAATGMVNRRADLERVDMDLETEASTYTMLGGKSVKVAGSVRGRQTLPQGDTPGRAADLDDKSFRWSTRGAWPSKAGELVVAGAYGGNTMLAIKASSLYARARQLWQNGACVEIEVLEGQGKELEPGQQATVRAKTRHRQDGGAEDLPIDTRPRGGSVTPDGEVQSEATWTYTAQQEGGELGLTSVSQRGIGWTTVDFGKPGRTRLRITITSEAKPACHSPFTATWEGELKPAGKDTFRGVFRHVSVSTAGCGMEEENGRWVRCWTRGELELQGEMRVMAGAGMKLGNLVLQPTGEYRGDWSCPAPKIAFPGYGMTQLPVKFPAGEKGKVVVARGDDVLIVAELY
jgi:hypothetical protein